ncbi:MAG TPA: DUF6765 family protein [Casimicrobiaceae bacterium]|jgi:hypothetical protein
MTALKAIAILAIAVMSCTRAEAFESDVHFGLTQWLALQAGFTPGQARTIAIGDNRVDSGDMQYIDLLFVYACLARDDESAQLVSKHHFPTDGMVPGSAEQRAVSPASDAAQLAAKDVLKAPLQLSGSLLYKLGEALHALQDSWSHQGTSEAPRIADDLFECDPARAWSHSRMRGGWNSHKADQTMHWPDDTRAMAQATFEVLTQYPKILGEVRSPKKWEQVRPELEGFIKASTKHEKQTWFMSHGIDDTSFLGDTTLKDGGGRFDRHWPERKLPQLTTMQSRQHRIDTEILDFYSRFFTQWMSNNDFDGLANAFGATSVRRTKGTDDTHVPMDKRELAAHLKLWRLRDHGMAADLAHAAQHLTAKQVAMVNALAKSPGAYVRYESPTDALFPLVTKEKDASPLLPFIVYEATPSNRAGRRMVATAKFRHAPYDIVGVVAERIDGQWKVVSIVSAVDH